MTTASVPWLTWAAAPLAPWRITSPSTPMAATVRTVSRRLSPLLTLEPLAETLMTSAESHLPAISKDERVRVESSKKRLTTVRPRRAGSFLTERCCTSCISAAVSNSAVTSSRPRSSIESRCLFIGSLPCLCGQGLCGHGVGDPDLVVPVGLLEAHHHALAAGAGEVLANVVAGDGQLAVARVEEYGEPHRVG